MKKARPRPPPPPAPPDSAEEPFWNFNWKHFPPRLPEKGRERGSAPPLPIGESLGVTSKPLRPARDEDDGERSGNAKRESNGAHGETPDRDGMMGWETRPRAGIGGSRGGMGSTPVLAPHHVFEGGVCGLRSPKGWSPNSCLSPCHPIPLPGASLAPQKGSIKEQPCFLKSRKWQLS